MNKTAKNFSPQSKNASANPVPDADRCRDGGEAHVLFHLARMACEKGELAHAAYLLHRAVRVCPQNRRYRKALGEICIEQKQYEAAVSLFKGLIAQNPSDPAAHFQCGVALERSGKAEQAVEHFQRAVELDPGWQDALFNLGLLCHRLGRLNHARQALEECLKCNQDNDSAWINLGNVLNDAGDPEKAYHCWRQAMVLTPENRLAHYNIGTYYQARDMLPEAVRAYQQALRCDPHHAKPHLNIALCYQRLGDGALAMEHLQKAVNADADYALAWYNLATAHRETGDTDSAVDCYKKVVYLEPENDAAWYNLAICLRRKERIAEAIAACSRALRITPHFAQARAYLFQLSQHACDWDLGRAVAAALDRQTATELSENRKTAESPMLSLRRCSDPEKNYRIARSWNQWILQQLGTERPLLSSPAQHCCVSEGRLRVGYLSADFKDHAVAHHIRGLLAAHNRSDFKVFCYACNPADDSDYAKRIRDACDCFVSLHALSDSEAARRINDDKIDILVDMMGHTQRSRPAIAALRPAPVQVSYLGFLGTTGSTFIDYFVCDAVVVPEEHAAYYSENLVYLPDCYQVNDDQMPIAETRYSRGRFGLPDEAVVFCCFNQPYKIDRSLFETWMHILSQVSGSVLWLLGQNEAAQNNLRKAAEKSAIDAQRLHFAGAMRIDQHLSRLRLADIALDPFVYNGGATTANALWAGVPVVTKIGTHFVSRMSASALKAVELPTLIARTQQEYAKIAVDLALDHRKRLELRAHLQNKRRTVTLFDTRRFTRHLEKAYHVMVETHRRGSKPRSFAINAVETGMGEQKIES